MISTTKSNTVGIKKIIIPAIARNTNVLADFFISSSLFDNIALPKSMLPNTIKIIGISIFKIKNTQPKVVKTPCTGPSQKVSTLNSVSSSSEVDGVSVPPELFKLKGTHSL